jgi:hypothetical protein
MPTGANLVAPANPFSRTGYTFIGYWDTAGTSGGTQYYNADMTSARTWNKVDETVILYARWTAITYTVAFNANGGTGTTANQTHTFDSSQALRANGFSRTHQTFLGWATSATGAVVYSNQQSVLNLANTQGATVTLWAVWAWSSTYLGSMNVYFYNMDAGTPIGVQYLNAVGSVISDHWFAPTSYIVIARQHWPNANVILNSNGTQILTNTAVPLGWINVLVFA